MNMFFDRVQTLPSNSSLPPNKGQKFLTITPSKRASPISADPFKVVFSGLEHSRFVVAQAAVIAYAINATATAVTNALEMK